MGMQYQEGMAVYIKNGVSMDAWGREVDGFGSGAQQADSESVEAPQAVSRDDREDDQYDNMSADELKEELRSRHESGREIDTTGVRRKADLAQKLREDDEAQAQEQQEA